MRRSLITVGLFTLAFTVFAAAQPPAPRPLPPAVSGVQPAAGTAPVPAGQPDVPLARFDPLAAWPAPTQQAVRSALLGSAWMTRMSQPQGRFQYGYLPALRQPMDGDHELRQALGAWALAQAAKFAGDERQAATTSQAVLALLAATRIDPAEPNCRVPMGLAADCSRPGFAAVLALAIYDLPGADAKLTDEAERLCHFLRKHVQADGSLMYVTGSVQQPGSTFPLMTDETPGFALHALAVSNRVRPAGWKAETVKKGCDFYRAHFRTQPHPLLAATLTAACTEIFLQTKSPDMAAAVFEMNDWLAGLQYPPTDPRHPTWVGGFMGWRDGKPVAYMPGADCGACLASLSCACQVARHVPDPDRYARYRQSACDAITFLSGLQYIEANTRHFENAYRANTLIGGFYLSPADGNLRVDATAWGVLGMLRFLGSGAER
jgi:hypothetical protein